MYILLALLPRVACCESCAKPRQCKRLVKADVGVLVGIHSLREGEVVPGLPWGLKSRPTRQRRPQHGAVQKRGYSTA